MYFEDERVVKSLLDNRLRELRTEGHITDSIFLAALDSPAVTLGILIGYLETCWALPPQ